MGWGKQAERYELAASEHRRAAESLDRADDRTEHLLKRAAEFDADAADCRDRAARNR